MPTTRTNAEAIARARGYAVTFEDGRIAIHTRDGQLVHRTTKWAAALKFLLEAPRIDNASASEGAPQAARSRKAPT